MAQTTPPSITAAPSPAPQRGDKVTFSTRVDAFVTWLIAAVTQFSALATNAYSNAVDCYNNAVAAASSASAAGSSATSAAASAAAAAGSVNAPLWVSGATVAQYATVLSPADNLRAYRRITATGSGTTDPKNDLTNYAIAVPAALTLLATITPTAAATVDFLSTFSSTFDNIAIMGTGLKPSVTDQLYMRGANAGAVDSGSNYAVSPSGSSTSGTQTSVDVSATVYASGKGCNFRVDILNANDATNGKLILVHGAAQESSTPAWHSMNAAIFYAGVALSGVRFFWNGGANFSAQGKIRVYGYNNS